MELSLSLLILQVPGDRTQKDLCHLVLIELKTLIKNEIKLKKF